MEIEPCDFCYEEFEWQIEDIIHMCGSLYEGYKRMCSNCIDRFGKMVNNRVKLYEMEKRHGEYKEETKEFYVMVTVAFKKDIKLDTVLKKWKMLVKKKWIVSSYSCIEWGDNKGMHMHVELKYNKGKYNSQIERECINTCKTLVGDNRCIDFRYNTHGFKKYIEGYRDGKKKNSYDLTIENRVRLGLPNVLEEMI